MPGNRNVPTPRPGDVTTCLHCGSILEFTNKLGLKFASKETLVKIAGHVDFIAINEARENYVRNLARSTPVKK